MPGWLEKQKTGQSQSEERESEDEDEEVRVLREEVELQERETGIKTIRTGGSSLLARTVQRVTRGISGLLFERDYTDSAAI